MAPANGADDASRRFGGTRRTEDAHDTQQPAQPGRRPAACARRSPTASIIAWRNLKRVPRIPELAIFAILQSIMFVLLFAFVFGGAIPLPGGGSYREFLMPGIFAQTVVFAAATTAIGMTDDINKGIIDRFRSLPMARSAVLTGRAVFDVVYQRRHPGRADALRPGRRLARPHQRAGVLRRRRPAAALHLRDVLGRHLAGPIGAAPSKSANQVGFTVIFPITFLSNVFVPTGDAARAGCSRSPSGTRSAR